ncbi:hypothetical protein PGJ97_13000 [Acinetobacter baumannii]|uniref:hypothetical protein n=4 Tax=Acinetobacter baumannii TaxID=470 RepID=UPI00066DD93B|nr:hypothetical protein [Acinetobacter baumannii]SSW75540.1 Uncharacterised protein [Klebsiella pneumoniae]KMV06504.1 hypothetical protein AB895_3568 [Acinetobacter baumannii]MBD0439590.1 hypothetical protein [Acinetobacter baumannii]MCQ1074068.1 hypothetical protein [Acinetobacter baumannii]MCT9271751.1 hypothetical protein [Acinetobacter baumannii]
MSKLTLPFYREFFEILESNEILNWRASDFVQAIFDIRKNMEDQDRQLIYRGLVILVECKYLKREKKAENNRIYRYSEAVRLKVYKENIQQKKIKEVLITEQNIIEKSLQKNKVEQNFLQDIVQKHPDLQIFLDRYDQYLSKKINELEIKMMFIKLIVKDLDL